MSNEIWFYAKLGQQIGPVSLDDLRQLVALRRLGHADLVWREGTPDWVKAANVAELNLPPASIPVASSTTARPPVFWLRVGAALIDVILLNIGTGMAAGILFAAAASPGDHDVFQLLQFLFAIVGGWLYAAFMESSTTQATLGKMICGLKVTDENGNRLTFNRATGRHFAKFLSAMIFCIGYVMAAFTRKKQALHDIIAQTLVVPKA